MKLIIAGGRDFDKYYVMSTVYDQLFVREDHLGPCSYGITEIVSGKAQGADTLGEKVAKYWNIPVKDFPADWELYGKSAGHIRNGEMARYADELLAFWDTTVKGSGTYDMIQQMTALGKPVHIVTYKPAKAYPK